MQLKRVKRIDFDNEYEEAAFIPPRAKPFTGPLKVGDFVEIAEHGYIRAKYRLPVNDNGSRRSGLRSELFS